MRILCSIRTTLFLFLFSLVLGACSWRQDKLGVSSAPISENALHAFSTTVYAYARQNCVGCHESQQNPLFAQKDIQAAYRLTKLYVDFQNISQSTLVFRTRNGHCGPGCKTDGNSIQAAIQSWWENGEKQQDPPLPPPPKETVSIRLPAKLPTGPHYLSLEWPLDSLGADFVGAKFSIDIQRFDSVSYRFQKPRLTTSSKPLSVRNIKVLTNSHFYPANTDYTIIERSVDREQAPVLSSARMLVLQEQPLDAISVSFEEIKVGSPTHCKNFDAFKSRILPILSAKCFRCHKNDPTQSAYAKFKMDIDDNTLCTASLERVESASPINSPLVAYPNIQANGHPVRVLSDSDLQAFLAWIQSEI